MPISCQCPTCRRNYTVRDDQAGKKVRCKQCSAVMTVPQPTVGGAPRAVPQVAPATPATTAAAPRRRIAAAPRRAVAARPAESPAYTFDDEPDAGPYEIKGGSPAPAAPPASRQPVAPVARGAQCPSCGAKLAAGAVVCMSCGFNARTGERVKTQRLSVPVVDTQEERRPSAWGAALRRWDFLVGGLGLAFLALAFVCVSVSAEATGVLCMGVAACGATLMVVGSVLQIRAICEEGFVQLLLCWFVPFYGFYYLVTRWETMCRSFTMSLVGVGLLIVGAIPAGMANLMPN